MENILVLVIPLTILLILAGATWLLFRNSKSKTVNEFFDVVMNLLTRLVDSIRGKGGHY